MRDARRKAQELKREERSRDPPERYGQNYSRNPMLFPKEPETYNQAITSCEKENRFQAMHEELKSSCDSITWALVDRPRDKNVIRGKWVYEVNTKADGRLENSKARYVARGFKEIHGID